MHRDRDAAYRRRHFGADPWTTELQDHAIGVLQLHAAGPRSNRTARTARRIAAGEIAGLRRFKALPTNLLVEAPMVKPTLMPDTVKDTACRGRQARPARRRRRQ